MTTKTFECPDCAERFRVTLTDSTQVVECPHCHRKIRIPAATTLFTTEPPQGHEPSAPVAEFVRANVRACVVCEGKFRISEQMRGTRIACPLCGAVLHIEDTGPGASPSEPSRSPPRTAVAPPPPVHHEVGEATGQGTESRPPTRDAGFDEVDETNAPLGPAGAAANALGIPVFEADEMTSDDASAGAHPESTASGRRDAADSASHESSAGDTADSDLPLALLPPTFDVFDPERVSYRDRRRMGKVVLPDSVEGEREVDQRIVHVWYKGEWVPLVARTPEEQAQYRFWVNTISIAVGLTAVVVAILILLR